MTKHVSKIFLLLSIIVLTSQAQWINQTSHSFHTAFSSVCMTDSVTGWLAGVGLLAKTTNGGNSWAVQENGPDGTIVKLRFLNNSVGFAGVSLTTVGGALYKTYNGGKTWMRDTSFDTAGDTSSFSPWDFTFTTVGDFSRVWMIAANGTPPMITYFSDDTGKTWNKFALSPHHSFSFPPLAFPDTSLGFTGDGTNLYRTTDGGLTWDSLALYNASVTSVYFFSPDSGIFMAQRSIPFQLIIGTTTDGGGTWDIDSTVTGFLSFFALPTFRFLNMKDGFCIDITSPAILRTTDGGASWSDFETPGNAPMTDISTVDGKTVVACGNNAKLFVSHDSGATYQDFTPPEVINFSSVQYLSDHVVTALGNDYYLFTSDDSGSTWTKHMIPTGCGPLYITFLDTLQGWVVDDSSRIYYTPNRGDSWILQKDLPLQDDQSMLDPPLYGIDVYNNSIGCAVGFSGFVCTTTNGGTHWSTRMSGVTDALYGVCFASASQCWAVGENGTILHSSDTCTTWLKQQSHVTAALRSVTFTDTNHGYILGDNNVMLKTTDGGATWELIITPEGSLNTMAFVDADTGWVVGGSGAIYKTIDGGNEWKGQSSGVENSLTGVDFLSPTRGIVVGESGVVLTTRNAGGVTAVRGTPFAPPGSYVLEQNYPNPFNPSTTIRYRLPVSSKVLLEVFDLLGRKVETLVDGNQARGSHEAVFTASRLSSGMYVYKLQAGGFSQIRKMVLIK